MNNSLTTQSPLSTFSWLLKREFWEYRGSFYLAPLITAVVMLSICMLALISAEIFVHQHGVTLNGINLDEIQRHVNEGDMEKARSGIDMGLLSMGFPIAIVLFFVVLSYCIGALFNDRADRSVLFWKSLPLSDTQTVLAKVVAATLIAPVFATGAMIVLQLGFLVLLSLYTMFHGVNALGVLWSPTHLTALWAKLIVLIPVNALWALPSVGWLLLCSSFVRSKVFLWAFGAPIVSGVLVSWINVTGSASLAGWYWHHVVGRVLLSIIPGSWMSPSMLQDIQRSGSNPPEIMASVLSFGNIGQLLASPNLWIGAAAGIAMIAGAIYFRRQRTESYA